MTELPQVLGASRCARCGTQLSPTLLVCPACHTLVHAAELNRLATEAEAATAAGDGSTALERWRRALELLPPGSKQHTDVAARLQKLSEAGVKSPEPAAPKSAFGKWLASLGAVGLALWKLKFAVLFVLSKGKLLLLGLTKMSTLLSMVISLGAYWTLFGWKFAAGLIASIYVHEMGHVAWLRRYGIAATAPMFIPGFGALVRLKQYPATPTEDARIGLAGPMWGTGAAIAFLAVGVVADWPSFMAIARVAAWLNLFNLLPVWQLDGSRGFNAMSRAQRWLCAAGLAGAWFIVQDGLLVVLAIFAALRAASPPPPTGDRFATAQYLGLVAVLSAVIVGVTALTATL